MLCPIFLSGIRFQIISIGSMGFHLRYKGKITFFILFMFLSCAPKVRFQEFIIKKQRDIPSVYYIENVPFFKQNKYNCGPSALYSVLNFYGEKITIDEIISALRKENFYGSLNIDMFLFPRRFGLITEMVNNIESIRNYIRNRNPVILLVDNGYSIYRLPHYIVVIGFDEEDEIFVAHWGNEENKVISLADLERRWSRMGRWGFVTIKIPRHKLTAEQHNDLGVAYENAGKYEDAENEYKEALRIKADFCEPKFNLGNLYFKINNYSDSEKSFLSALEVCKDKGDIYNNLALLYLRLNRRKEASFFVEKALELSPDNPEYLDTKRIIDESN